MAPYFMVIQKLYEKKLVTTGRYPAHKKIQPKKRHQCGIHNYNVDNNLTKSHKYRPQK